MWARQDSGDATSIGLLVEDWLAAVYFIAAVAQIWLNAAKGTPFVPNWHRMAGARA
jgi:hypothetical protein